MPKNKSSSSFKPGDRFQTNDTFRLMFSRKGREQQPAWRGVVRRKHDGIAGAWWVEVTEPALPQQQAIHEKFMEATND